MTLSVMTLSFKHSDLQLLINKIKKLKGASILSLYVNE
jgi:hypothetical protein